MAGLSADQLVDAYTTHRHAHDALIMDRAKTVKTRTLRGNEHRQALVQEIADHTGIELPEPAYLKAEPSLEKQTYRSSDQRPTGYWKQSVTAAQDEVARAWAQQGNMTLELWTDPSHDMDKWPDDRCEFVKLAKRLDDVGTGAGHRL
jgi:hypothetical protein